MFDAAAAHGGGVFVLALTSNPEGPAVQHARTADGRTVAQTVIDEISQLNAGAEPLGSFGLVVGATIGDTGHDLSRVSGPLLAPGLGAQGGTAADLRTVFGDEPRRGAAVVLPGGARGRPDGGRVCGPRRSGVLDDCRGRAGLPPGGSRPVTIA